MSPWNKRDDSLLKELGVKTFDLHQERRDRTGKRHLYVYVGQDGLVPTAATTTSIWAGEMVRRKKATRMMETFFRLFYLCAILLVYGFRGEGRIKRRSTRRRKRKKPNCHLHRLGREFTLDVADLKSVVGAHCWHGHIAIIQGKRSRLVIQPPATTPAHTLVLFYGRRDDAVYTRTLPKVPLGLDFLRLFPPFSDLLFLLGHLIHPTRFSLPSWLYCTAKKTKKGGKKIEKKN